MIDPARIYDICQAIKDAVIDFYAAQLPDPIDLPDRQYVANSPLAVALDCDQLVVSCERVFGYTENPALQTFEPTKGAGHAMRSGIFQVTIARCINVPEGDEVNPIDAEEESSAEIYSDAGMMLNALIVAEKNGDLAGCKSVVFLDWSPPEVDAELAAGTLRVQISLLRA